MVGVEPGPTLGTTILLFGSQAISFNKESLDQLKHTLLETPDHQWALDTIEGLPDDWECISRALPQLQFIPGSSLTQDLKEWLRLGKLTKAHFPLPNILLTPLTVISHLVQYSKYLDTQLSPEGRDDLLSAFKQDTETLGLCTGLLSAFVVSCSANRVQFEKYSSAAVRQAMLIGALIDAQDSSGSVYGLSKSFATVWNSAEAGSKLAGVLDQFPGAYTSVSYDENRATVTSVQSVAPVLIQQLKAVGITATEINLCGRFHSELHENDMESIIGFCDSNTAFQLPDASEVQLATFSNSGAENIKQGKLHHIALKAILVEHSNWYKTFSGIQSSPLEDKESLVVSFGQDRCIPPSLLRTLGRRAIHLADRAQLTPPIPMKLLDTEESPRKTREGSDNDIAVIGMSCKVAGADDLEEFWKIVCEGKSQHVEVPDERVNFETHWREIDPNRKWYGNFVKDHDAFDHKFFGESPREASSQDPQQRLMMQVAYQAVEQSGYFNKSNIDKEIGCYIGVVTTDYENNIASHAPNAFSATGNLRSFIAGRISHYFGWTGPGMTIDTACSSSAVSIHQACKAILSGECTTALAGGVSMMTSPFWYQNLASASFLSPTGQCKPFDSKVDGYCRGEGIAAVFLKKMSAALADGDQIFGCIASTVVTQNENCTPIFVPNAPSLSNLFMNVTQKAKLEPRQISVVEAHGTGTVVGDPAEYESIRRVLGGSIRSKALHIGSVKGLIGHTEAASGVIALIKILLMIHEGVIPPQASFQTLSPHITASPSDMMEIVRRLKPWDVDFRAALINNYGASGSNASLVVTQPFQQRQKGMAFSSAASMKYPFWISGSDAQSIREYSARICQFIDSKVVSARHVSISNLSFNLARQSNRSLDQGFIFGSSSLTELEDNLKQLLQGDSSISLAIKKPRPVVLCFGGQISTFVGLDPIIYRSLKIFRYHLDQCNSIVESLGLESIYPDIFERTTIVDTVKLQTMLFAIQYSCAMAWIDSGVKVTAIVGHSFGELTGLCVSGILSLEDTMKLIAGRARLVRDLWGSEKGSMMAIEADLKDVHTLIAESEETCLREGERVPTIACFNGPRSFTVAGSTKAIDAFAERVRTNTSIPSMKTKRLNVSNAFHSTLVEPLMADLEQLGQGLTFKEPTIPLERATEFTTSVNKPTPEFAAAHMRNPVYFNHAVQRLSNKYPSAIWLEAGSNSTITSMVSRALGSTSKESHFQAINITSDAAMQNLTAATMNLWKEGLRVSFWGHHTLQADEYSPLILPPYQFAKARHWMEIKKPATEVLVQTPPPNAKLPEGLWSFVQYTDKKQRCARFQINTSSRKYENFVSAHIVAETGAICPATLQMDMAIEALMSLHPEFATSNFHPVVQGVHNVAPLCINPSRLVWLDLEALEVESQHTWSWKLYSTGMQTGSNTTVHVSGKIIFRSVEDENYQLDFARYERLVSHQRYLRLFNSNDAEDVIQGRQIYKSFREVVDYTEIFRGIQKIVGKDYESAGRVVKQYTRETWLDTPLSDCFCQVTGIWVNCMTDRRPTDIYLANGFETYMRSPKVRNEDSRPEVWDVFACHHRPSDKDYLADIFVFDSTNGALMEVILGINFTLVSKVSMSNIITRLSAGGAKGSGSITPPSKAAQAIGAASAGHRKPTKPSNAPALKKERKKRSDIFDNVKLLLANVSGLDQSEIQLNTELAAIGIDSLMSMELAHDIKEVFRCEINPDRLAEVADFESLVKCVEAALGSITDAAAVDTSEDDSASDDFSDDNEQSFGSQGYNTPMSESSISFSSRVNVVEYLAELLGISEGDIPLGTLLRDLGVDSLLATEVRSDLSDKFSVQISKEVSIEDLTVEELNVHINGMSKSSSSSIYPELPTPHGNVETAPNANSDGGGVNGTIIPSYGGNLNMPTSTVLEAFGESKLLTDQFIANYGCADYLDTIMPRQTELCVALTIEAFEQLGCDLRSARTGQKLERIQYVPKHERLVEYLYAMLCKGARLIDIEGSQITRTAISPPSRTSHAILEDLMRKYPDHGNSNKLVYFTGSNLADVLTGKSDGTKLIFGTEAGREFVAGLYGSSPLNKLSYKQMESFMRGLISKLPMHDGSLKILEMGAGTGGATRGMATLLASLNIPVEYTFTDLSPSMVAAARTTFKQYPFMKFRTHDIEKQPADDLLGTQHIVIASNVVHATHSLTESAKNIRKALRPDGFLMMVEMTETMYWIDVIFGILESWWLFDDGRRHALAHQSKWDIDLRSVGYSHVDWTDGYRPEVGVQRVIIALANGSGNGRVELPLMSPRSHLSDCSTRQVAVDEYIRKSTQGFFVSAPSDNTVSLTHSGNETCVLITGATGSLGSHLVAHFAQLPEVKTVICLNRRGNMDPAIRQKQALESRGLTLDGEDESKLKVLEADSMKPMLGLPADQYAGLLDTVTHVLHNAWPMSSKRPLKGFESQFQVMRNLINFTSEIYSRRPGSKISFQLISSIAAVGHYPLWTGNTVVPEERVGIESVLPNGYGDAKFVCERMLDETLHKYPQLFRTMAVRLGQIAGSKTSGYWNPMEHVSFLFKSSQTLKALPDFRGELSWVPVNDIAATLGDLLLSENTPYPIYHIDNPVRQPWSEMIPVLAEALNIPEVIPFPEWIKRVRHFPGSVELDNPAFKLVEFLDDHFLRMSCGGLLLDTTKSREHSKTLSNVGPVSADTARKYIQAWKEMGFLHT